ncbi:sigma-54 interaction domain-containing protein [Caenispirillum bisanense]|uniref:sigma-54 interaction domain-containing protein n=1 Tax=Caenispirillum bisanense TaxID=414052 RepID=UPI000C76BBC2|nr:sigma-54 dependent transcriptional regulator [Caenispirillum bisanense]
MLYIARDLPAGLAPLAEGFVVRHAKPPRLDGPGGPATPCVAIVDVGNDAARITEALAVCDRSFPLVRRIVVADAARMDAAGAEDIGGHGVDYLAAAPADPWELAAVVRGFWRVGVLERVRRAAEQAAAGEPCMIGTHSAMKTVFSNIRQFAQTDAPVLVTGESGTGKELAARAIHERSAVASGPFVAINCAGIPADLVASELFGYEKGAFTGALGRKIGRIESAAGGTLFLDEIGDFPLALQAHLLRFLQEGTIERLGGVGNIRVRARIITGTHVDLEAAVAAGRFRQDLFFRINVLRLHLPPLRERGDDVALIARYFIDRLKAEHGRPSARLATDAVAALAAHPWPGNVRELISAVRRGLTLCRNGRITAADLGLAGGLPPDDRVATLEAARAEAEKHAIGIAMRHAGNRPAVAAELLGVSRGTLYSLFRKHCITASRSGGAAAQHEPECP